MVGGRLHVVEREGLTFSRVVAVVDKGVRLDIVVARMAPRNYRRIRVDINMLMLRLQKDQLPQGIQLLFVRVVTGKIVLDRPHGELDVLRHRLKHSFRIGAAAARPGHFRRAPLAAGRFDPFLRIVYPRYTF